MHPFSSSVPRCTWLEIAEHAVRSGGSKEPIDAPAVEAVREQHCTFASVTPLPLPISPGSPPARAHRRYTGPFVVFLTCLLFAACGVGEENVNVRLTLPERERLDKMVLAHMDSLRPLLEAECARTTPDRIALTTDSIVQRALEQEARLRARIGQSERE